MFHEENVSKVHESGEHYRRPPHLEDDVAQVAGRQQLRATHALDVCCSGLLQARVWFVVSNQSRGLVRPTHRGGGGALHVCPGRRHYGMVGARRYPGRSPVTCRVSPGLTSGRSRTATALYDSSWSLCHRWYVNTWARITGARIVWLRARHGAGGLLRLASLKWRIPPRRVYVIMWATRGYKRFVHGARGECVPRQHTIQRSRTEGRPKGSHLRDQQWPAPGGGDKRRHLAHAGVAAGRRARAADRGGVDGAGAVLAGRAAGAGHSGGLRGSGGVQRVPTFGPEKAAPA